MYISGVFLALSSHLHLSAELQLERAEFRRAEVTLFAILGSRNTKAVNKRWGCASPSSEKRGTDLKPEAFDSFADLQRLRNNCVCVVELQKSPESRPYNVITSSCCYYCFCRQVANKVRCFETTGASLPGKLLIHIRLLKSTPSYLCKLKLLLKTTNKFDAMLNYTNLC